jgi:hypothetical protein
VVEHLGQLAVVSGGLNLLGSGVRLRHRVGTGHGGPAYRPAGSTTILARWLGCFPAGSQTTISVPSVEFPDGYQVSVTGGEVVSAPNAAELVIASNA